MNIFGKPLRAGAVAIATLIAAACGSNTGGATPAASSAPVTITFSTYAFQPQTVAATRKIVDDWNKAHPNITVQLVQVDPNSVHDKLVTQFQGNTAPDVIHDEAADLAGFAKQGFLADMSPMISSNLKGDVSKGIWDSVTFNNKIVAAPTLLQTYNVFANKTALSGAGVTAPTIDKPWTWDQFGAASKQLSTGGKYGVGWGLKSPTATIMSMALNYNGKYFYDESGKTVVKFGTPEQQVVRRIHDLAYTEKSLDPVSLTQSGADVIPAFFAGKYAMIVGGNYIRQNMVEQAPAGFQWEMLPLLKGDSQAQNANPQTLSIAAQSQHKKEAMQFIEFFETGGNLASVALGDWLAPATTSAGKAVVSSSGGKNGWDVTAAGTAQLSLAPFQKLDNYPQWKSQIATPAFQQYLGDKIDLATLGQKLTTGWTTVNGG
jgi:multiple sugar transport system substrate-binding protein